MIAPIPALPEHVDTVLADPSEQTLADLAAVNLSIDAARDRFIGSVVSGDAVAGVEDDVVMVVLGWDKLPGVWYSWLLTSAAFFDPDRPGFVLATRRYLRGLARANPGVSLLMVPAAPLTPRTIRWMTLLGYLHLPERGLFVYKHGRPC